MKNVLKTILIAISITCLWSCEREFTYRGGEEGLYFSMDTVMFDTIFTSIGSTTQNFKVYNPYDEDLLIKSIELAGGESTGFRINVNGYSENALTDVQIGARDSLFIFVEITIDPMGSNKPFVVNDSIIFQTSKHLQSVKLVAYGQDVVLMRQEWLKTQTLTKDKPYLIYDYVVVDSAETVSIDPGARLYFYKDASLLVLGTLEVNGTKEEPVLFTGHRQEEWYEDKPGQWGYIHLLPESGKSTFNNAIIKNGMMGILADSVGLDDNPIEIHNTRIEHISSFGLLAQSASLNVSNCIFGDSGNNSLALTVGGSYEFNHCTFANYFDWTFRTNPSIFLNNYFLDENDNQQIVPLKKANFYNCIIYGKNRNELGFDLKFEDSEIPEADAKYLFDHCLIRLVEDFDTSDETKYKNIITDKDPSFIDYNEYNYQLDTLSAAKDIGKISVGESFPFDILNISRLEDDGPDLGAYERVEKSK
ncbi:hypothetical protein [Carboxylicivirga sp. N1Y90]|uniref:hypothetical protein n=1 Tax=Carboxylicivirga fragile TaxID=3417571 RepID=UPI003D3563D4|nr:hypothetical protein [Marinilabiliaceae bacterium N1Y90]